MHEIRVEDLTANDIYVLMLKCDIRADVADMWREKQINGKVIIRMESLPLQLLPTRESQKQFNDLYEVLLNRRLPYPQSYSSDTSDDQVQSTDNSVLVGDRASSNQQQPGQLRVLSYPTPLPKFSSQVEHGLQDPDLCISVVYLMNRELIDFYLQNNFRMTCRQDYHCISRTVLSRYPVLNRAVTYIMETENRLRQRKVPVRTFMFLSEKLNTRRLYVRDAPKIQERRRLKQQQKRDAIVDVKRETLDENNNNDNDYESSNSNPLANPFGLQQMDHEQSSSSSEHTQCHGHDQLSNDQQPHDDNRTAFATSTPHPNDQATNIMQSVIVDPAINEMLKNLPDMTCYEDDDGLSEHVENDSQSVARHIQQQQQGNEDEVAHNQDQDEPTLTSDNSSQSSNVETNGNRSQCKSPQFTLSDPQNVFHSANEDNSQ